MICIPFGIVRICSYLFKCIYLKNEKPYLNFLFHLWNLHQILNIFERKDDGDSSCIFELRLMTVKDLVRPLSKKPYFRTPFGSQHVKGSETLVKSAGEHFYHIFWSLWGKMVSKISHLLKFEILGGFVNTLTADDNHHVGDCENLQFPIQKQLT